MFMGTFLCGCCFVFDGCAVGGTCFLGVPVIRRDPSDLSAVKDRK
jgi:hypothetical protein